MNQLAGLRLICVDDEQSALKNCEAAIDGHPNVLTATFFQSPVEAIAHVQENQVDVALLDVDMPDMNGFELAQKLQSLNKSIKIAFITGNIHYMRVANRPIQVPFVFKPYSDYDISDALERMSCGA